MAPLAFYEFFAGGGMVRAGLGSRWRCAYANDLDPKKGAAYRDNWGEGEFTLGDVAAVQSSDLPGRADLMWGSFPCQDLSEAGRGAGLEGGRSAAFFPFWRLVTALADEGRAPRLVAIENVRGALTGHGGRGFGVLCEAFAGAGYRFGALMIDAALFVPQSRPRLFIVGAAADVAIPARLMAARPSAPFHSPSLARATGDLPARTRRRSLWWRLPQPKPRRARLADLIEDQVPPSLWGSPGQTTALLAMMSPLNRAKVEAVRVAGGRAVGGVFRRTRARPDGLKSQRAEVRFDGVAGCLRTPAGGSSRQAVLIIEDGRVRSRLLTPRETARLMGLPDSYRLPSGVNEAYHLTGDGVAVDVVRHLAHHLLEPLLTESASRADSAPNTGVLAAQEA